MAALCVQRPGNYGEKIHVAVSLTQNDHKKNILLYCFCVHV